jgi:hypothetical protein
MASDSDVMAPPTMMKRRRPSLAITVTHSEPTVTTETRPYVKNPQYTWDQLQNMTRKQKLAALQKSYHTRLKLRKAIQNFEHKLEQLERFRVQRSEIYKVMKNPKIKMGSPKWNELNARAKKLTEILALYDEIKIDIQKLKQRLQLEDKNSDLIDTNIRRNIL